MSEQILVEFNSPSGFLEWATHAPCLWDAKECESRKISDEWTAWTQTRTYEDAYNLALFGWPEGLKRLTHQVELAGTEISVTQTVRQKKKFGYAGYSPDPERAAAGEMFSMAQAVKPQKTPQEPVKIRYNITREYTVDTATIIRMGAALCSYVEALEKIECPVQLEAVDEYVPAENKTGPNVAFRFPLKSAGVNLSMADLIFWVGHPSASRRISFSGLERLDIEQYYLPSYGRVRPFLPVPEDTLCLSINDAKPTLQACLKAIRDKHMALGRPDMNRALHQIQFNSRPKR